MSVELEQIVGPALRQDGIVDGPVRIARFGAAVVTDAHGRFTEATFRGTVYSSYLQNASAVAAGQQDNAAAAASTNFALWNPKTSNISIALLKWFLAWKSGTPVAGPIMHAIFDASGIANSVGAQGNAIVGNRAGGSSKGNALVLASAAGAALTGGIAPLLLRPSDFYMTATAPAAVSTIKGMELLDGDIVLPPGWGWVPLFPNGTWTSPAYTLGVTYEEIATT